MSSLLGPRVLRRPEEEELPYSFGPQLVGGFQPSTAAAYMPGVIQGYRDPLDPNDYSDGTRLLPPPFVGFVEPPAAYMPGVIQGFRDPLDPAYYSEGPVILRPVFSPAAPASPWFPGWPLGMFMAQQNAQQGSDVPGGGIGAGHGSRILVNTRGGGVDAWAWQNG